MAEQNQASAQEQSDGDEVKTGGRKKGKIFLIGLIGGVMLIEGVAIFAVTRFMGGPAKVEASVPGLEADDEGGGETAEGEGEKGEGEKAEGKEGEGGAPKRVPKEKEIVVASFRAMNDRSGHNIIYDIKVYAQVAGKSADKIQRLFETRKASIEDRMAKVIRAADPQYFKEPGLETLRRQLKHEVDAAIGDANAVQEILIPSLMWYSADS